MTKEKLDWAIEYLRDNIGEINMLYYNIGSEGELTRQQTCDAIRKLAIVTHDAFAILLDVVKDIKPE